MKKEKAMEKSLPYAGENADRRRTDTVLPSAAWLSDGKEEGTPAEARAVFG